MVLNVTGILMYDTQVQEILKRTCLTDINVRSSYIESAIVLGNLGIILGNILKMAKGSIHLYITTKLHAEYFLFLGQTVVTHCCMVFPCHLLVIYRRSRTTEE